MCVLLIVYKVLVSLSDIQNFVTTLRKQSAARKVCIAFLVIKLMRLRQPLFCDGNSLVAVAQCYWSTTSAL